jgi:hypothetical protein
MSGSHGDKYEEGFLLGCCAVLFGRDLVMFRGSGRLFYKGDDALVMEAAGTYGTSVNFCQITQSNGLEERVCSCDKTELLKVFVRKRVVLELRLFCAKI